MDFKKLLIAVAILSCIGNVNAQSSIIRGEVSAGVYENFKSDGAQALKVSQVSTDPCQASGVAKSSVAVNISTAATTALVALSGTTIVYVCGFSLTISQVITTPNTLSFVYGTGATCGTGTVTLTGLFGGGGVTAAPPITVTAGIGSTLFKTIAGNALCAVTAIGGSGSFQGVVTYVQQ